VRQFIFTVVFGCLILGVTFGLKAQDVPKIKTTPTPIVEAIPLNGYEKREEEKEPKIIRLTVDIPMEAKIAISGKIVTYTQFSTLMEFAGNAFKIEEMVWRGGRLETVKLSVKE
jgi:hypothetical protein